jgi:hypothetical protein
MALRVVQPPCAFGEQARQPSASPQESVVPA